MRRSVTCVRCIWPGLAIAALLAAGCDCDRVEEHRRHPGPVRESIGATAASTLGEGL